MNQSRKQTRIDIVRLLQRVVDRNTHDYRTDFDYDREELLRGDKPRYLFMSRLQGTWLFEERAVYIRNTHAHKAWIDYVHNRSEHIQAFAMEVTERTGGRAYGVVHELDYPRHVSDVLAYAQPPREVHILYDDKPLTILHDDLPRYSNSRMRILGYISSDDGAIDEHLREIREKRSGQPMFTLKDLDRQKHERLQALYEKAPVVSITYGEYSQAYGKLAEFGDHMLLCRKVNSRMFGEELLYEIGQREPGGQICSIRGSSCFENAARDFTVLSGMLDRGSFFEENELRIIRDGLVRVAALPDIDRATKESMGRIVEKIKELRPGLCEEMSAEEEPGLEDELG